MAVLDSFPSQAIIKNMHGILDFYYYKGIPVVRTWPRKPQNTPAMRRTHENMRRCLSLWKSLPMIDYRAFSFATSQSELTNRDMFLSHTLLMQNPRTLVNVLDVKDIAGFIHIWAKVVQGDKPQAMIRFTDTGYITDILTWQNTYKEQSGYKFNSRWIPYFSYDYLVPGNWAGDVGEFVVAKKNKFLLFCFNDPQGDKPFSSGVYRNEF